MDPFDLQVKEERTFKIFIYAHLFTDLASRQVYPVFTKSKLVTELIARMALLFHSHPE